MFFYSVWLRNRKYGASRLVLAKIRAKCGGLDQKNHTVRKFLYVGQYRI